mmetsp:Transcript_1441/g.6013  ORF Transcript_1441/g.6013 Transcript_1441/m.6013 type:complete len:225 (-) Transcript_1441:1756-2430(-)
MFLKSLGEKVASFHANSAGPCQCFIFGESKERAPNSFSPRVSRHKRTSVAPASSAFCTSSEITPGPSAYASRMCRRRVVKASLCPNASASASPPCRLNPMSSEASCSSASRSDATPAACAVELGSFGWHSRVPAGGRIQGASLNRKDEAFANTPRSSGTGKSERRTSLCPVSETRRVLFSVLSSPSAVRKSASAPSTHSATSSRRSVRGVSVPASAFSRNRSVT